MAKEPHRIKSLLSWNKIIINDLKIWLNFLFRRDKTFCRDRSSSHARWFVPSLLLPNSFRSSTTTLTWAALSGESSPTSLRSTSITTRNKSDIAVITIDRSKDNSFCALSSTASNFVSERRTTTAVDAQVFKNFKIAFGDRRISWPWWIVVSTDGWRWAAPWSTTKPWPRSRWALTSTSSEATVRILTFHFFSRSMQCIQRETMVFCKWANVCNIW